MQANICNNQLEKPFQPPCRLLFVVQYYFYGKGKIQLVSFVLPTDSLVFVRRRSSLALGICVNHLGALDRLAPP